MHSCKSQSHVHLQETTEITPMWTRNLQHGIDQLLTRTHGHTNLHPQACRHRRTRPEASVGAGLPRATTCHLSLCGERPGMQRELGVSFHRRPAPGLQPHRGPGGSPAPLARLWSTPAAGLSWERAPGRQSAHVWDAGPRAAALNPSCPQCRLGGPGERAC